MGGMRPYIVRQGDYLARVASRHGVDAGMVWNHAANKDLRAQRGSPNVLLAGDVLMIPEQDEAPKSVSVQSSNTFSASVAVTKLKVSLIGEDNTALSGVECVVHGLGQPMKKSTDGDGRLEIDVPVTTRLLHVEIPSMGRRLRLDVGHLDPVDEQSGATARLRQLGYIRPPYDADTFTTSLRDFQKDRGLTQTGELDTDTVAALRSAYGT